MRKRSESRDRISDLSCFALGEERTTLNNNKKENLAPEMELRASLKLLNTRSKSELVADTLISKIQSGEYPTASMLPTEAELVRQLGVSRSTVREAVKQLVSQNILEIHRGRGTFVSALPGVQSDPFGFRFHNDKLQLGCDLCEVRLMIEPKLAYNAALSATPEQFDVIASAQAEVIRLVNSGKDHEEADIKFHCAIASCTENVILKTMMQIIYSGIPYLINLTDRGLCEQAVETHQMVVNAILKKDAVAAEEAMRLHIQQNLDDVKIRIAKAESRD